MDNNQQNPGSFMAPTGQQGQGSALMRLMQLRQKMGASPQSGNNVVTPSAPPTTQAIPQGMQVNPAQAGQQAPQPQPQQGQPQMSLQAGDPNLQVALQALSNYVKSHGNALEANHNVPMKKAQAAAVQAQGQPQGGE